MNWGSIGEGAAQGAAGQAMSLIFGGLQNRRQLKQAGKLQKLQIEGQKEMGEFNRQQAMQMWRDTNYSAQVEEARKAGMSISALYGGAGGGGGATAATPAGNIGGQAAEGASAGMNVGMQMASQMALMKAQKENIEADTANKKAQTENTGAETTGTNIENEIKAATKEDSIRGIVFAADKLLGESMSAFQQGKIDEATRNDRIEKIKAESVGSLIENEAKKKGIQLDSARINEISNNIAQRWKDLELSGKSLEVSRQNMEDLTEAMLWGAGIQATGNLVKGIIDVVGNKGIKGSTVKEMVNKGKD